MTDEEVNKEILYIQKKIRCKSTHCDEDGLFMFAPDDDSTFFSVMLIAKENRFAIAVYNEKKSCFEGYKYSRKSLKMCMDYWEKRLKQK